MILADLGDLISTGGMGTVGQSSTGSCASIFLGFLPPAPDLVIALFETGGSASVHGMSTGPGNALLEHPRVQAVVRGAAGDYLTPRTLMNTLFRSLDGVRDQTINGCRYNWIAAVQSPFPILTEPDTNRVLFSVNFDVYKSLSTSTST